jgi:RNA polymerase sigma-70 factor (ECF subfamily)
MLDKRYLNLESIPRGVLVALEQLGPLERAVYMLHNVLRHSPREIALALNMTEHAVHDVLQRTADVTYSPHT